MKKLKNRKIILISLLAIVLYFLYVITDPFGVRKKSAEKDIVDSNKEEALSILELDIDGDGVKEIAKIIPLENKLVTINLHDENDVLVASLPQRLALPESTSYSVVKLNEKASKEFIRWDVTAGPHQIETVFLTSLGNELTPVYSLDTEKKVIYTPFYNSRGDLIVSDINRDGYVEVIEFTDEYPLDSPRLEDEDIKQKTLESFGESGEDAFTIISRENNGLGRGRKVIWAIYSFFDNGDAPVFMKLLNEEYSVFADVLVEAGNSVESDSIIKYTDLKQESIDFNIFVRKFWSGGAEFEFAVE